MTLNVVHSSTVDGIQVTTAQFLLGYVYNGRNMLVDNICARVCPEITEAFVEARCAFPPISGTRENKYEGKIQGLFCEWEELKGSWEAGFEIRDVWICY